MIKTFLNSPTGCMLCLIFFASTLIERTKNIARVLAITTNHLPGYQSGYYWGYKCGCATGIIVESILIAGLLFKLHNFWNNKKQVGV